MEFFREWRNFFGKFLKSRSKMSSKIWPPRLWRSGSASDTMHRVTYLLIYSEIHICTSLLCVRRYAKFKTRITRVAGTWKPLVRTCKLNKNLTTAVAVAVASTMTLVEIMCIFERLMCYKLTCMYTSFITLLDDTFWKKVSVIIFSLGSTVLCSPWETLRILRLALFTTHWKKWS